MRQALFILFIFSRALLFAGIDVSNEARPVNNINMTLLGDASIISGSYERLFLTGSAFIIAGKLGFGYTEEFRICLFGSCSSPKGKFLTIPHHITGNLGKSRHFLEFGLGGTIIAGSSQGYLPYPMVGYRLLPLKSKRINLRILVQYPLVRSIDDVLFIPLGISAGISF